MKRIKHFLSALLTVICAILGFALAGCAKEGSLVDNSLQYEFYVYDSLESISLNYSFSVSIPDKTNYTVDYTLSVCNNGKQIQTISKSVTLSPKAENKNNVSDYISNVNFFTGAKKENLSLKITSISVKPKEKSNEYQNYAIGFGVVGGAALTASTVLFIVLKQKEKK